MITGLIVDTPAALEFRREIMGGISDAQLQAAVDLLTKEIQEDPRPVPATPPYPDKSFKYQ